jgi:hypothetical protein
MSEFTSSPPAPTAAERLQKFAEIFPDPEKIYFLSLIAHQDAVLLSLLQEYDDKTLSIDELKVALTRRVVKMSLDNCFTIYTRMFAHMSTEKAKQLVKGSAPVASVEEPSVSLTYGEIDFFSLACILEKLNIKKGDSFVDLGHGTGKGLICASLLYGTLLSQCIGMELIPELYQVSIGVMDTFRAMVAANSSRFGTEPMCELEVMEGDILGEYDWTAADIVFANSTCFDMTLMEAIGAKAITMRPGTKIVTLTKQLPSEHFTLVDRKQYVMSWGEATAFTHVRK